MMMVVLMLMGSNQNWSWLVTDLLFSFGTASHYYSQRHASGADHSAISFDDCAVPIEGCIRQVVAFVVVIKACDANFSCGCSADEFHANELDNVGCIAHCIDFSSNGEAGPLTCKWMNHWSCWRAGPICRTIHCFTGYLMLFAGQIW